MELFLEYITQNIEGAAMINIKYGKTGNCRVRLRQIAETFNKHCNIGWIMDKGYHINLPENDSNKVRAGWLQYYPGYGYYFVEDTWFDLSMPEINKIVIDTNTEAFQSAHQVAQTLQKLNPDLDIEINTK